MYILYVYIRLKCNGMILFFFSLYPLLTSSPRFYCFTDMLIIL